jgi:hypothetical protein
LPFSCKTQFLLTPPFETPRVQRLVDDFDWFGLSQGAYRAIDLYGQQLVLACRQAKPPRVVDRPMCIRKDDDGVLTVQQVIDLIVDALDVRAESLPECHSSASAVMRGDRSEGRMTMRSRGSRAGLFRS